ncbi:MAG: ABC transporter ATP-binding protein [Pseudobdellovibrionaceae bacterium]
MKELVRLQKINKTFGAVKAAKDVSFVVREGEIVSLIGENGAGKSTAAKILFGLYKPDSGQVYFKEEPVELKSPEDAGALGIGMVHQHFMLAPAMTALDHMILQKKDLGDFQNLNRSALRQELNELSLKFKMPVDWEALVEDLPVGVHQRIEILKALAAEAKLLILDEPTAVLSPQEIDLFLERLLELKKQGYTIILITHKLREVLKVSDQVVVFRRGEVVGQYPAAGQTLDSLSELMVGHRMPELKSLPQPPGAPLLSVKNLSYGPLKQIEFQLRENEIVGIAGVEGHGQSELLRALLMPQDCGLVGSQYEFLRTPVGQFPTSAILAKGLSFIGEDRHHQSCVLEMDLSENFLFGQESHFSNFGWINKKSLEKKTLQMMEKYDVRPLGPPDLPFQSLSGGNQQKFVVGRELSQRPRVLIAAQPTRGVDIGAIDLIHRALLDFKNQKNTVLLISSELEELLKVSDRIFVLREGEFVAEFSRAQFDEQKIGQAMLRGRS